MVDGLTSPTRNVYGSIFEINTLLMLKDLSGDILNVAVVNDSRHVDIWSAFCPQPLCFSATRLVFDQIMLLSVNRKWPCLFFHSLFNLNVPIVDVVDNSGLLVVAK